MTEKDSTMEKETMKFVVAGSRWIKSYEVVKTVLADVCKTGIKIEAIIDGTARGVDELASRYARENSIENIRVPADWKLWRKAAGKKRNEVMGEMGDALVAIWDGTSKGTEHMISVAEQKGLKIFVYLIDAENNLILLREEGGCRTV